MNKKYLIFGIIIVVIAGAIVFVNYSQKGTQKSDNLKPLDSLEFFLSDYCVSGKTCDLECESDSDCVLMTCRGFRFAAHKDVVDYLDNEKIIRGWCSGSNQIVKSDEEKAICSSSLDVYPETYKRCIFAP